MPLAFVMVSAGALACTAGGCVIDDSGNASGRSPAAPTATVPESGSPLRWESAARTLDEAGSSAAPRDGGEVLELAPRPTPPPVR